jgi:UPF0755 protein
LSERPTNRPGNGQRPIPRRDPNDIAAHVRNRDRSDVESHLRNQNRAAIDQHLKERDKSAAARERTITEAQARSRARQAGEVPTPAYIARGNRRSRNKVAIIIASLITVLLVGAVIVPPLAQNFMRSLAEANPDLMRVGLISDAVSSVMDDRPDKPAGTDPTQVSFEIKQGESSAQITQNLVDRGLITDRLAFTYVLVNDGGINNLHSGTHILNRTMSPREIATALQGQPTTTGDIVQIALREGLRFEQVVAYLQTLPLPKLDPEQFYELASDPPASLRQKFPWMAVIPAGRSVEGFLGSGVYSVDSDADAETILEELLKGWQDSAAYDVMQQAQAENKDFYQTVIMASIVEREALHDADKPKVAGVYQNRIDEPGGTHTLNADPVLIYANDTLNLRELHITEWPDYVFWTYDGIGAAAAFEVPPDLEGYQVWHSRGLPPGPIASPGVASLQAALNPDTKDGYLFFLGKNDGSGELVFAHTYEEHLHNIELYLGGSPEPSEMPLETLEPLETLDPSATEETSP